MSAKGAEAVLSEDSPVVVCFGGGVNSSAMLLGAYERGISVDLVLFADTGGEKPETYNHIHAFSAWLVARGMPPVTIIRRRPTEREEGRYETLEEECRVFKTLPAIAFGHRHCSTKWKREPQELFCNNHWPAGRAAWDAGGRARKWIGFSLEEVYRRERLVPAADRSGEGKKYLIEFPLIDWGWDRADCVAAFGRHGLAVPPKSACFFCPATRKREVLRLARDHPDLFARCVAMERAARANGKVHGNLGRHWSWEALVAADEAQGRLFPETIETPCMCVDDDDSTEALR